MLNRCLSILVDQLCAEGIADPLAESFTLAALWDDLAAIADDPPPAFIQTALGGERVPPCASSADTSSPPPSRTRHPGDAEEG